ncbi:hypothetical protein ABT337_13910 [Saccharopolyspora hirsuta]|uniref:Uncharacterized protein n=1 Tax=Saccharopolyspora hirsuta TaxID=1837 RepID=A0A5M7C8Y0_SACHI|nr:hypothetical protein [Saccharopolyspora hirsuta]KAA5836151.1 hypothetical protein F1721_07425 [Saccharopolyspora hirsuta]
MRRVVVGVLAVGALGILGSGVANAVGEQQDQPGSQSWGWQTTNQEVQRWQGGWGSFTTSSTTTSSTQSSTTGTSARSGDFGHGGQGGHAQGGSSHSVVEGDGWAQSYAQGESAQGSNG